MKREREFYFCAHVYVSHTRKGRFLIFVAFFYFTSDGIEVKTEMRHSLARGREFLFTLSFLLSSYTILMVAGESL